MKRIIVFGSTGSIGRNLLDIVEKNRDRFQVRLLSCRKNVGLLIEQARKFQVPAVHLLNDADLDLVRKSLPATAKIFVGSQSYEEIINEIEADLVVNAIVGSAGLEVSYYTLKTGITLALANKESLVAGGELLSATRSHSGAVIIPIDSEHSALFQCLKAGNRSEVEKIILTASGGPFRSRPKETFASITVAEALRHPKWLMGSKITIDSATLMNKGLEIIEAHYLFDIAPEQIEVVVHPESVIHSMVQFHDGSVVAQLSPPDMRLPIAYALEYPNRLPTDLPRIDFPQLGNLTFEVPDKERFPSISLAYKALTSGGVTPLVLNAANEVAVEAFLAERIRFSDIPVVVEKAMTKEIRLGTLNLPRLLEVDREVRHMTEQLIKTGTLLLSKG